MEILSTIVEPSLESALADIGVSGDFWRKALGVSREKDQGDLSLPCFPFAKQLGRNPNEIASELANQFQAILMFQQQVVMSISKHAQIG